jgi:prephenate dehydratase
MSPVLGAFFLLKNKKMVKSEQDLQVIAKSKKTIRVAIQGYAGAFHDIAARLCFKDQEVEVVPAHTFEQLIQLLETDNTVDAALMAIENTLYGSLMHNYKLLNDSNLTVTGEVFLRIKQNLMVLPGTELNDLKEVHSHPVAIDQCRKFFLDHPHIRLVETVDTALSAKNILDNNLKDTGAIASTLAADLYDLDIIAEGIETHQKNHTRFLVLRRKDHFRDDLKANKVSISFSTTHEVGSLHSVLALMAAYNLNLTKIQSSPIIGKPWEYLFFVDFVMGGKISLDQGIGAIRPITQNLKVLGAYPVGEHHDY